MKPRVGFLFFFFFSSSLLLGVESKCSQSCDLSLASYYVWRDSTLSFIAVAMDTTPDLIASYNRDTIPNIDAVQAFTRINIPFSCDCLKNQFLGHTFKYKVERGDTYALIAKTYYANLTTVHALQNSNDHLATNIPEGDTIDVIVNCSCGNREVSNDYGLFITYPLRPEDSLESIANKMGFSPSLLQSYNPGVNFSEGSGLVYIPGKDQNGSYRPLNSSPGGLAAGVIAGMSIGGVVGLLLLAVGLYAGFYRKQKVDETKLLSEDSKELSTSTQDVNASGSAEYETSVSAGRTGGGSSGMMGITVDQSVEFSYEELAKATNNFSMANKIGQGGFGAVYYAELRGERAAIKKMDMQATKEFLAELKVLTHVHHLNLVRLIGYCVRGSLFLVYEYIENGNLGQHLRGSGREPLPWSTRVQIALDSARGLEYIHEHTVPVYIHRDIKSANILVDKNFRGKVADFGLTKLTEVGNSLPTRLVGTFGYMPPEYAQYGDVSPKIDVYAFGVVLYELISAKEAVVKTNEFVAESKGLVAMFEGVLNQPDPTEGLCKLVDPRLGDNYPLDAVRKMAQLAKACTQDNPQLRPSMRSIVVALMTLSSATDDWDVGSFYENQTLLSLMSGR